MPKEPKVQIMLMVMVVIEGSFALLPGDLMILFSISVPSPVKRSRVQQYAADAFNNSKYLMFLGCGTNLNKQRAAAAGD